ncbi:asparagine synthase (glutamine-hydrolyzing) [Methyloglobulus sp.]|uniref:asparagine synthase (glutamine-hydrolyzing) n=1 Tax=Methyloglobulus sp. TaxID=2518622 RepID=UPI0032B7AE74
MCGISGIYDRSSKPIDQATLERMTTVLNHRGPDGAGYFLDGEIGLGHRRLSIIDVEGGAQPMFNKDETLQIVFNGEIYNFIELRNELKSFGHSFKTLSDTEVIIYAYEQWGIDCVNHFNGMFAFAIWDKRKKELFLARDHLGIKPLYYSLIGGRLIFASEIKALLQVPDCQREMGVDALAELFTFRYVPSPKTLFKGIFKLPPGHLMLATKNGIQINRYWKSVPCLRKDWREEELIEEYQVLLEDTVRLQLRSDVPLGLFLSSGVDSGALLAIMSKYSTGPVQTFTIGFEGGEKTNEVDDAKEMARRFGAEHYFKMLNFEDYSSYFERYMEDLEEPVAHEPAPAFYFLAQETSKHVKVALSGQGADEPWAGYDRYLGVKLSALYSRLPRLLTQRFAPQIAKVPLPMERLKRGISSLSEPDILIRFTKIYSFFSADMKAQLYTGMLKERLEVDPYWTREALRRLQKDVQHLDPLTQMLYIDTRANLPDDLLMVADKTSMANSLEVRVPFLDYRLVEFIESLPPTLKLNWLTGKYLHKKAMIKWLPQEVVYRKKKGFAHPIADWLRGSMKPLVEDCLLSSDSSIAQYFDQNYMRQLVQRHQEGKEQYMRHIYLLVSLELWHRNFLNK